ncbi:MAG TPA: hypothetical protein VFP80_10855 [Thermoanaerobaculia bacterium]|nr:hypothetical protein [Thermoanaerobaculia bacterium]
MTFFPQRAVSFTVRGDERRREREWAVMSDSDANDVPSGTIPDPPPDLPELRSSPPGESHVWIPGRWQWNAELRKYEWIAGHWA